MPVDIVLKKRRLAFVKEGGAGITATDEERVANVPVIERALKEIWEAKQDAKADGGLDIVLGHGAGSFGHIPAKRYQTNKGLINGDSRAGAIETELAVMELSSIIAKAGERVGVPVFPIAPSSFAVSVGGNLFKGTVKSIEYALESGFLPLVRGDVMLDKTMGVSIGSTEKVFRFLAKRMKPDIVILGTDVDGVFDMDPIGHSEAKIIPRVDYSNKEAVLLSTGGARKIDVTGGMKKKVEHAIAISRAGGCNVYIVNALTPGTIGSLLRRKTEGVLYTLVSAT
jgi:isopentenyl phosphate kinase